MRSVPTSTQAYQNAKTKEPVAVIVIYFGDNFTDPVYFTTKFVDVTSSGQVVQRCISKLSSTSQRIEPENSRSTIGTISFDLVDRFGGVTAIFSQKDTENKGLKGKSVRVYHGYEGMVWADIEDNIIQTQIIDDIEIEVGGKYSIKCADINRSVRTKIFTLNKTSLTHSIDAVQTLIPVESFAGFEMCNHGDSYEDAPNALVGYIKIEDEIIRWTSTTNHNTLGPCFVAAQRGALQSSAAEHEVEESDSNDRKIEVSEFVYIELPVVKLIYAILTSDLHSQPGENWPSNWGLNIPGAYVRTSDFENIGQDLWDVNNDDDGIICFFAGENEQDAKAFIEKQLCFMISCYTTIYSNGEIGLRRFTSALQDAPYVETLNDMNVVRYGNLKIDQKSVFNFLSISWNYEYFKDKTTRKKILTDNLSITKHGLSKVREMECRGLHGSRHTTSVIEGLFNRARDRYSSPPHKLSLRALPYLNYLEAGDIVRVSTDGFKDYFRAGQSLNRSMEIQKVTMDWLSGNLDFELFGSTSPASNITPQLPSGSDQSLAVMPDSFYTATGTAITAVGGQVVSSLTGAVRHITGGTGIVGSDAVNGTRIYCNSDLELNNGVTLNFTRNTVLVVRGHLQINGTLNGAGRGNAGAAQVSTDLNNEGINEGTRAYAQNVGIRGYIGPTWAAGGFRFPMYNTSSDTPNTIDDIYNAIYSPGRNLLGDWGSLPVLNITYRPETGNIRGLPANLMGTSGSTGNNIFMSENPFAIRYPINLRARGGAGGAGGAGLVIICRGIDFGVNGRIITSGANGQLGEYTTHDEANARVYAGSGAGGAPGACIILIDGIDNSYPVLNASTFVAEFGDTPVPAGVTHNIVADTFLNRYMYNRDAQYRVTDGMVFYSPHRGYSDNSTLRPDLSGTAGGCRAIFIPPTATAVPDAPAYAAQTLSINVSEVVNTPATQNKLYSTIEISVSPPNDSTYSYSRIYKRRVGGSIIYEYIGDADDELTHVMLADGHTYDFTARSVNIRRLENSHGPVAQVTTTPSGLSVPSDVSEIYINYLSKFVEINWNLVVDERGVEYEVRRGTTWIQSAVVGRTKMPTMRVSNSGTYWVGVRVPILSSDTVQQYIYSASPAFIVVNVGSIGNNIIITDNVSGGSWPDVFDGTQLIGGNLRLNALTNFLSIANVLTEPNVLLSGGYTPQGEYRTIQHEVGATPIPCDIVMQYSSYNVDAAGNVTDAGNTNVIPIISFFDGTALYPWMEYKPGTYYGTLFFFGLRLQSLDGVSTPVVTDFQILIDVPDRIVNGNINTSASALVTVTISPAFNGGAAPGDLPVCTASIINAVAGDHLAVSNVDNDSVQFEVRNAGSRVVRAIHYSIHGY